MSYYKGKKILVIGGTGLIGMPLVHKLLEREAKLTVVSLDENIDLDKSIEFKKLDLRDFNNCLKVTKNKDIVFNLAGIKGSPKMTKEKPASFFVPTLTFSVNIMEAARRNDVKNFLFTSSVGVYQPAEIFHEESVWKTFPSENDKFAGWAKRMGELQAEAYRIQYGWDTISIVRPANVYGPYDNFDPENAMVIPSLIKRILDGERPLKVWGNGEAIRDFIFSEDVADGMLKVVEKKFNLPVNLGSGKGFTIKELVDTLIQIIDKSCEVIWDKSKPTGDRKRIMDTQRARNELNFIPATSLTEGLEKTVNWFLKNHKNYSDKYNSFLEKI